MTIELEPKAVAKQLSDRMKISLLGYHTMKQKGAMFFDAKFFLEHEYGIRFAGQIDLYPNFVDQHGQPITHFSNGNAIGAYNMIVRSPYHCAADHYRAGELYLASLSRFPHSPRMTVSAPALTLSRVTTQTWICPIFRFAGLLSPFPAARRGAALRLQLANLRDGAVTLAPLPLALRDVLAEFVDHRREFAVIFPVQLCF